MNRDNPNLEKNMFVASVDPVIFSIINDELHILLIKRTSNDPKNPDIFEGYWAFPGGLMEHGDASMEAAVSRVLALKTGAKVNYVEQLNSRKNHDPRGATLSVSYIALVDEQKVNENAVWMPVREVVKIKLAFDHNSVVEVALQRLKSKVNYSTLPMHFLPQPFTLPKLQRVYEILLDEKLHKSTFRIKIEETNAIYKTGEKIKDGPHRPSDLYRLVNDKVHNFDSNIVRSSQKA
jgi:8-oxo-dGTP diphosphatase